VEFCIATRPIHALKLINKDSAFDLINNDWQRERVGFALAGQRANYKKAASPVIALVGKH
jgi:hypothetical protein